MGGYDDGAWKTGRETDRQPRLVLSIEAGLRPTPGAPEARSGCAEISPGRTLIPRLTARGRAALHELPVWPGLTRVDGRTLAGLQRKGLAVCQRLRHLDGRSLLSADGGPLPRRLHVAALTATGRLVRDYYDGRKARRLDRQLRRQRRALRADSL